jgi:hypothetical protein
MVKYKVLIILIVLIVPLITFQNCGRSGQFDGISIDSNDPGGSSFLSPFVPRPIRSTDTGNPHPTLEYGHVKVVNELCTRLISCGIIQEQEQCGQSQSETVEFLDILSLFQFESYEQFEQMSYYIAVDVAKSNACHRQFMLKYLNCETAQNIVSEIQMKKTGTSTPLNYQPDWYLDLWKDMDKCHNVIFIYEDYLEE